jgi:hypothetical protein
MPVREPRHQFRHGGDSARVVNIVEDEEPGRMGFEPSQNRLDLGRVLARLLLGQIENLGAGERSEIGVERRRVVGAHEDERRIVGRVRNRVFDGKARLADSAEPMQRHAAGSLPGKRCA